MDESRRVSLSRPLSKLEDGSEFGDEKIQTELKDESRSQTSETNSASLLRLPPINHKVSPEPEIYRRTENAVGPPVNRAQALRYNKIRQDMTMSHSVPPYLPKRFRNGRMSNIGTGSLDSSMSGYGTMPMSGMSSPAPSRHSRMTDSNYSVVHPLSINSHDELYFHGKTQWTKNRISSKVGSLDNYHHVPGGGDHDINEIRYQINAPNTISSRTRILYGPRRSRIRNQSLQYDAAMFEHLPNMKFKPKNVQSKCGSLENIRHRPGGGTKAIFTERMPWQDGFKHRR